MNVLYDLSSVFVSLPFLNGTVCFLLDFINLIFFLGMQLRLSAKEAQKRKANRERVKRWKAKLDPQQREELRRKDAEYQKKYRKRKKDRLPQAQKQRELELARERNRRCR